MGIDAGRREPPAMTSPAPSWRFSAPTSRAELDTLLAHDADAIILAGGQGILPILRAGGAAGGHLVDVTRIAALRHIDLTNGTARIGATVTFTELLESEVASFCPALTDAIAFVGTRPIRNRVTVGGSLAWAAPRAELPLILLAVGATIRTNYRAIAADTFLRGAHATALSRGEAVLEVEFAAPNPRLRFEEVMGRNSAGRAIALVAVEAADDRLRATVGGVVDRPVRSDWIAPTDVDAWLDRMTEAHSLLDDPLHSPGYRRALVRALIDRAAGAGP